jgi:hypothetical protein|eukprot:SAG25_NODE_143_length_14049_cov_6.050817_3_plen_264_part_00
MSDPRASHFADTLIHATGVAAGGAKEALCADSALLRFLEDPSCALLVGSAATDGAMLVLTNELPAETGKLPSGDATKPTVVLTKTQPLPLSVGNMLSLVAVSTLQGGSPLASLAASLTNVYAPLLRSQGGGRLQTVLAELQAGLASELRLGGGGGATATRAGGAGWDEGECAAVHCLADELAIWSEVGGPRAKAFAQALAQISRPWAEMPSAGSEEVVLDLLESTQDVLDVVWKLDPPGGGPPYPQPRMERCAPLVPPATREW